MKYLNFTLIFMLFTIIIHGCGSTTLIESIEYTDTIMYPEDILIIDTGIITDTTTWGDTSNYKICKEEEACNQFTEEYPYCHGECFSEITYLSCEGIVIDNLCYLTNPPEKPYTKDMIDDIKISNTPIPEYVHVGDKLNVEITLTNLRDEKNSLAYSFKNPDNWEIQPENFDREGILNFDPKEEKRLKFYAKAIKPDIFQRAYYYPSIISLSFNNMIYELYTKVNFEKRDDYIKCGEEYFPPTYCSTSECLNYSNYYTAVCCKDVFYPGSGCCENKDCQNGVCIDGKCISKVPLMFTANNTLIQHNRILVIIADVSDFSENNLCSNKYDDLRDDLQLDLIEDFFKKIVYSRTGRKDVINFKWEVLAGFNSEKIIKNGDYTFLNFKDSLNNYINSQLKCDINFDNYDKLIIISPKMDLYGFGGMAFGQGYIGQIIHSNGYLTAHELSHSFGASDLYMDLGGQYQYSTSLMGNNLGQFGFPQDKVMWGEIGLSDINNNGIIDLFEFAKFPDSITIENIRAKLTNKESLEITFEPYLLENNKKMKGVFTMYHLELPEYDQIIDVPEPIAAFDKYQVDLNKIRETKKIKVRMILEYKYSDKDFNRKKLKFDKTTEINVEDQSQ